MFSSCSHHVLIMFSSSRHGPSQMYWNAPFIPFQETPDVWDVCTTGGHRPLNRWDFTMFKATDLCTKCLKKKKVSRKQLPSQDISRYLKSRFATSMALDGTGSQIWSHTRYNPCPSSCLSPLPEGGQIDHLQWWKINQPRLGSTAGSHLEDAFAIFHSTSQSKKISQRTLDLLKFDEIWWRCDDFLWLLMDVFLNFGQLIKKKHRLIPKRYLASPPPRIPTASRDWIQVGHKVAQSLPVSRSWWRDWATIDIPLRINQWGYLKHGWLTSGC